MSLYGIVKKKKKKLLENIICQSYSNHNLWMEKTSRITYQECP